MMSMRTFLTFCCLSLCALSCMEKKEADFVIHNAVIYTVDESFSIYEAMAVRGDSILEVGAENQILNKYSTSRLIDLNKKFIYPGFIDAHSHFKGYAESLGKVNLLGVSSPLGLISKVGLIADRFCPWKLLGGQNRFCS